MVFKHDKATDSTTMVYGYKSDKTGYDMVLTICTKKDGLWGRGLLFKEDCNGTLRKFQELHRYLKDKMKICQIVIESTPNHTRSYKRYFKGNVISPKKTKTFNGHISETIRVNL